MVNDQEVLEKEDAYILDRIKEFISREEVCQLPAAKNLMTLIERSVIHRVFCLVAFF
jgi:son of sevenless-like protein